MPTISDDHSCAAQWRLADHVHATAVDDDVVILNVLADAYLCLRGAARDLWLADDGVSLGLTSPALAEELRLASLIRPATDGPPFAPRRHASPPTSSALARTYAAPALGDLPEVAASLIDLRLRYRGQALPALLNRRAAARRPSAQRSRDEVLDRFQRWIPYAPVSGKCLLRAFMLRRLLDQHGHPHAWVFGVTVWPFKAHCWLQADGVVLNDTVETVAAYRPIMVA